MTNYDNVLVVAPATNGLSDVENELRGLTESLRPVVLRNGVTVRDVTEAASRKAWDILWFACHGTTEGVELTDGILETSTLVSLVKGAGVRLVVLNTCESDMIGIYVWALTGAAVICTISQVPDRTAYVTGRLLGESLGRGLSIREAYERSSPGDIGQSSRYRLWETHAADDPDTAIAGTVKAISAVVLPISTKLDSLLEEVRNEGKRPFPGLPRFWVLAIAVMIYSIPFIVADTTSSAGIHVPWQVLLGITVSCVIASLIVIERESRRVARDLE